MRPNNFFSASGFKIAIACLIWLSSKSLLATPLTPALLTPALLTPALLTPALATRCDVPQEVPETKLKSFLVSCHSGTVLTLQIPDQSLQWIDLSTPERMLKKTIRLHDVRQAILGREAVGAQITLIRKLLDDLKGNDFLAREAAERELVKPDIGGRFRSMIEAEKDQSLLEIRYRVQRILTELDKREEISNGAFDQIQLQDGTWQTGDLGDFVIECQYRDQQVQLTRAEIAFLDQRIDDEPRIKFGVARPVSVRVSQRFDDGWKNPGLTRVEFESSPNGEPLVTRADVSNVFVSKGLLMRSERPGYIGISGYAFRSDCPPKQNSICVFESVGTAFQRFKGIMEFRFCLPNQREVAAGVHEFGLWVSRVDQPRDLVLEAYNSEGHLVGIAEASDANCTFHGIRSSEPIVRVRLLSNPYLFQLNRKVDEDYCVDDICFSEPVPLAHLKQQQSGIMTDRGDFLIGSLSIGRDEIRVTLKGIKAVLAVPMREVRSIAFANPTQKVNKGQRVWHAMLRDRSVVAVDPSEKFQTRWFEQKSIDPSSISALWLAPNELRYPLAEDFEQAQDRGTETRVMVFPTCRILTSDLATDDRGYAWSQFEKREQDLWIRDGESGKEKLEPDEKAIIFSQTSAELVPTLWLHNPPDWDSRLGVIRLTDGQQFVIGGSEGIEIAGFDESSVAIRWEGKSENLPFSIIENIDLPRTN